MFSTKTLKSHTKHTLTRNRKKYTELFIKIAQFIRNPKITGEACSLNEIKCSPCEDHKHKTEKEKKRKKTEDWNKPEI